MAPPAIPVSFVAGAIETGRRPAGAPIGRVMRTVFGLALPLLLLTLTACTTTNFYVVRHAEKQDPFADDPPLSDKGLCRARALAERLHDKSIKRIYVSDKQRTQQTAAPAAALFTLTPVVLSTLEIDRLIAELRKIRGTNVLVVRHSDELHLIVNALSPADTISPIPNEYDNLFVIRRTDFLWMTDTRLEKQKYGGT